MESRYTQRRDSMALSSMVLTVCTVQTCHVELQPTFAFNIWKVNHLVGFLLSLPSLGAVSRRSVAMNRSEGAFKKRKACDITKGMKEVQISKRVIKKEGRSLQVECGKAE